jgi:hypothetical protein
VRIIVAERELAKGGEALGADSGNTELGYGRFAGWYMLVLGGVSLIGAVLRLLLGTYPLTELAGGLLWLWFGWQVRKGWNGFRKAAIVLCSGVVLTGLVMLFLLLATGTPWNSLRILCFDVQSPSVALTAALLSLPILVAAVPLVALLHPRTRRAYASLQKNRDPWDLSVAIEGPPADRSSSR